MKRNFSMLLVVGRIFLASLLLSSFYSCGNEKPEAVEASIADQDPEESPQDTTDVQQPAKEPVVHSQRYDGSTHY